MNGRRRPFLAACLGLGVVLGAGGCSIGGSDEPTAAAAGRTLSGWMEKLPGKLNYGVTPLKPWRVTDDASHDSSCGGGRARRSYAATIDLPAADSAADTRAGLIAGEVAFAGWQVISPNQVAASSGAVRAHRAAKDDTGSRLTVRYTKVDGGWHYDVSARTACLKTSG